MFEWAKPPGVRFNGYTCADRAGTRHAANSKYAYRQGLSAACYIGNGKGRTMKFYGYFRSSAAYRCRIAFNLKGVAPDFVPVHLRKGEQKADAFRALNPHGLVPALETDGALLTQSIAIIEWLDETKPSPPLLPKSPVERAHVRALALSIACEIHPLQNLRVLSYLKATLGHDQATVDQWCRHWIRGGLEAYEATLVRAGTAGAFSFGDQPTLADICLMPQVFSAERFGADISDLKTIQRIKASADKHPAFAAAHPAKQPDFEV
jgi:maleylpyruvate isomerase